MNQESPPYGYGGNSPVSSSFSLILMHAASLRISACSRATKWFHPSMINSVLKVPRVVLRPNGILILLLTLSMVVCGICPEDRNEGDHVLQQVRGEGP